MTLEQLLMYYDYGLDFEQFKSEILIAKIGEVLSGKKPKKKVLVDSDKPDLKKFNEKYGDKIKKP